MALGVEVGVPLPVGEPLTAADALGEGVGEPVGDSEGEGVRALEEELLPELLAVEASLAVGDGVGEAEGVGLALPLWLPLGVGDMVPLALGVPVALCERDPESLELPPAVSDVVGVAVWVGVLVGEALPEGVGVGEGLSEGVGVREGEGVPEAVREGVAVPEREGVTVPEREGVAVPEREAVPVGLGVPLPEGEPVPLPVAVSVDDSEGVALGEGLEVGEAGQALKGTGQAPMPPGVITLTLAYTESATKSRPLQSTARPLGLAMSAAKEGPPSPKLPGQAGLEPLPITTPANDLLGSSLSTLLLLVSATKTEPQASTARPQIPLPRRLAEVARAPGERVEEPATPVPARVMMMRVEMFTALTRAASLM